MFRAETLIFVEDVLERFPFNTLLIGAFKSLTNQGIVCAN
jgi:hypothetical protein